MTTAELALSRAPNQVDIPLMLVRHQKSAGGAFSLACQASGLDDKEIYLQLDIDAGTFSRIKKGEATLQAGQIAEFCKCVGNTIYPEWIAFQVGCSLIVLETESERQLKAERDANEKLQAENRLLRDLVQGKR